MRNTLLIGSLLAFISHSGFALASEHKHMKHEKMPGMHATSSKGHMGTGVLNSTDLKNLKINLTHGPIKSLGWPGMTMDFSIKDSAILKSVKPGQKVSFEVVNEGPGKYFVIRITPLQ